MGRGGPLVRARAWRRRNLLFVNARLAHLLTVAVAAAARGLPARSTARRIGKISPIRKSTAPAIGRMPVNIARKPRQTVEHIGPRAGQPGQVSAADGRKAAEITTITTSATAR